MERGTKRQTGALWYGLLIVSFCVGAAVGVIGFAALAPRALAPVDGGQKTVDGAAVVKAEANGEAKPAARIREQYWNRTLNIYQVLAGVDYKRTDDFRIESLEGFGGSHSFVIVFKILEGPRAAEIYSDLENILWNMFPDWSNVETAFLKLLFQTPNPGTIEFVYNQYYIFVNRRGDEARISFLYSDGKLDLDKHAHRMAEIEERVRLAGQRVR